MVTTKDIQDNWKTTHEKGNTMRKSFEKELNLLNRNLIAMAEMATDAITQSVEALLEKDVQKAQDVVANDYTINRMERTIEDQCIRLILVEQPVASDLRMVNTALKMITDLERIGDQASDISSLTLQMLKNGYKRKELGSVREMAKKAIEMTNLSIKAYVDGDSQLAKEVIDMDDAVDHLFDTVKDEILVDIQTGKQDARITVDLLMTAKYLERIGDHAQNIAEWVYYSITGVIEHVK